MNSIAENKLPEGWKLKCLKEIGQVFSGSSAPQNEKFFLNGNMPFIRTSDLSVKKRTDSLLESRDRINPKYQNELNLKLAKKGTVLFPKSGAAINGNNRAMLSIDAFIVSHLGAFYSDNPIINKFVYLFMLTIDLVDYCENPSYPSLKLTRVKDISIPIPPIEEQKRIVAKIDNLFAKIDKAIRLSEESLKQAKNLLPSVLKEVFENCEGDIMRLDEVSVIQPKKNEVKDLDCEVSFVPMKFLNKKKIDFTPESDKNISDIYKGYTYFQDSDVILAKVIPCFQNGKSGVAKGLTNGIGFGSSEFIVFRPNDFILSEWLYYNISSPDFLSEGNNNMSGAVGLKRLTKSFVTEWEIKVPDLKTQKMYIDTITKVSNQSTQTQSKLEEQLVYLKQLKSSILSKAFKGEL